MRTLSAEEVLVLRRNPQRLRNICILAHVDHGKTSLADSLVASNGIISQRMAGRLRYMDSRPDEQERGITMKASAIALHHTAESGENFLINLIDSPGHVDFSGEVSTAVRICDGAIVVVDVVEGCAPQTVQVLRQAWLESIRPILILNKIDRLILEKKLTPLEAYSRIRQVLEQVNAVMGSLFATETLMKQDIKRNLKPKDVDETGSYDWDAGLEDSDDSSVYFQPELGNVVFASALDGWGFTIEHFAEIYSRRLGVSRTVLRKTLWGDFYLNVKEKKVLRGALNKGKKPLFVQFVLDNLWQVYEAVVNTRDKEVILKITDALGLKIHSRDTKQADPKGHLFAVCSQWLPLGKAILDVVCDKLPAPCSLSGERVESLISSQLQFDSLPQETRDLKQAFLDCSPSAAAPTIVFVSKMYTVLPADITRTTAPRLVGQALTMEEITARREQIRQITAAKKTEDAVADSEIVLPDEVTPSNGTESQAIFIGFARIFSGTLREGDAVFVLGPKHKPELALELQRQGETVFPHVTRVRVGGIYTMMGRELEKISEAGAGNVVGIAGLQEHLVRSGTLSSTVACPAFTDLSFMTAPIVRVAVEPKRNSDMEQLAKGLKLLYQADPCVEVYVQETGEHVLVTAGEVHLQRCLNDLTNTFAKIEINASEPIVPFRETVILPPTVDMLNEAITPDQESGQTSRDRDGLIEIKTRNQQCLMKIRCVPLPAEAASLLENSAETLKALNRSRQRKIGDATEKLKERLSPEWQKKVEELKNSLEKALGEFPEFPDLNASGLVDRIICFGPRYCGPNLLLNNTPDLRIPSVWSDELTGTGSTPNSDFSPSLITGFQLTTLAGPLCEEPMMGVCFILQEFSVTETPSEGTEGELGAREGSFGPLSGQIISTLKDGCRRAFQAQPQRLMVALYSSVIQTTSDVLGKVYGVINRRRGRVLSDHMQEGSDTFSITTLLPVCESFGFAEEIRKKTSGLAQPQLVFSHWEVLDMDPFWSPTTEEEYTHYGDKADAENIARRYMNQVRRRKGLPVEEKVVVHAEKQRTIKRNK